MLFTDNNFQKCFYVHTVISNTVYSNFKILSTEDKKIPEVFAIVWNAIQTSQQAYTIAFKILFFYAFLVYHF